jgi:predicted ATP-dependent endonuclease of OLD family
MLLKSVRITNFKSIHDSTEFAVGPITCLVGRNESGKSAILQALYTLNPVIKTDAAFDAFDFPRSRYAEFRDRSEDEPAPNVVTTTWELTEKDLSVVRAALASDDAGCYPFTVPGSMRVVIRKGYDNELHWQIPIDDEAARQAVIKALTPRLPKLVLFSDYQRLPGQIAINELTRRQADGSLTFDDRAFLALLELAGTKPDELDRIERSERLIAELEAVSNRISREIFVYWSQNRHLRVQFRLDAARPADPPPFNTGEILRIRIENTRHGVTVAFDERSSGFVWFFSFLVWFSQLRRQYAERLILLMDEPGLSLHPRAQADLLRYMTERLRPLNQVIYSTHSPFMIDAGEISALRGVEDVVSSDGDTLGTIVTDEIWSCGSDTLMPVRTALTKGKGDRGEVKGLAQESGLPAL